MAGIFPITLFHCSPRFRSIICSALLLPGIRQILSADSKDSALSLAFERAHETTDELTLGRLTMIREGDPTGEDEPENEWYIETKSVLERLGGSVSVPPLTRVK